jgi:zinc transport system ATP-binding protein
MTDAVSVENLTFGYYPDSQVLEKVSFTLARGQFLGLIGPNGGGKTTLIKILLGILSVKQGRVLVFGNAPQSLRSRARIGYVPQLSNIPKDFPSTVRDVILMGVEGKWLTWRKRRTYYEERMAELASFFVLEKILTTPIGEISGGQTRRVLLVRALLRNPDLLILDEPMAGVDSSGNSLFFDFIQRLKETNQTSILMSSHDVETLRARADRLICLNKVVHFCDSAHLISTQLIRHTYQCELETFYHNRNYHIFKNAESPCQEQEQGEV